MNDQIPSIGRIVHYRLSAQDAIEINRRRTTGYKIQERMKEQRVAVPGGGPDVAVYGWPEGAQAHIGNDVKEGDVFPMLIVRVWGTDPSSSVNGQVYLDGNDVYWATSRSCGDQSGQWVWPSRS